MASGQTPSWHVGDLTAERLHLEHLGSSYPADVSQTNSEAFQIFSRSDRATGVLELCGKLLPYLFWLARLKLPFAALSSWRGISFSESYILLLLICSGITCVLKVMQEKQSDLRLCQVINLSVTLVRTSLKKSSRHIVINIFFSTLLSGSPLIFFMS